jgi:hypothetical protein
MASKTTSNDFTINISGFVKKAKLAPTLVLRKIALDLFTAVVKRTPVDTGMLRANWQVGLGTAPVGTVSAPDKTGSRAQVEIAAKASQAVWGTSIFLVNNLPYATVVEYGAYPDPVKRGTYVPAGKTKYGITGPGWVKRSAGGFSKQAPAGMVRVSLTELKAHLDRIIRQRGYEPLT